MARTYNVSFNITGTEAGLLAALKSAQAALRGLGNSARAASAAAKASQAGLQGLGNQLKNIQTAATQFKTLQDALKQTAADFSKATSSIGSARAKMEADAQAAQNLRDRLSDLNKELGKAKTTKLTEQGGLRTLRQQMQELKRAFALAKSLGDTAKMSSLNSQMATLGATIQAQQSKVKAAAQAYKELSDKIKQTRTDLKAAEQAATSSGQGLTRARADAERLKQAYTDQLAALGRLRSSLSAAGFNVSSFAASESRLQSEINRVNAAIERQQNLLNAQRRSAQASQEMFNAYNNFQGALQTAQQIASPFTAAIDTAMDFEHAMSRVKALTQSQNIREGRTDVVQREMEMLTQQARDLGATTMFTSTQAAQAMGYLGMAGWKAQQIYGTMPGMLDLAAAAGADLAQTADIVSDNMTAMGVPVNQAAHFMDVYAYALTNSNARLSDFGETMKYAAPVAKAYGSTLDETAAMVMMMANAGIKGSMAGTSLRMGLLRLAGPPKTATKEMAKLGLSLSDAQAGAEEAAAVIKGLGIDLAGAASPGEKMTRVLMQLHEKTKDLSQDEKLAVFKGIFGVNAETGWLALFDQGPEVFLRYVEGLRNADGYARQVAKTMNDDTRGAIILLESAWDALEERIGRALLPTVKTAAEAFAPMVSAAAQWIETHPGVVQACAAIAGALAGLVVAAAAVKLAFAGWRFIASSIGLVQAALASLGSGALLGGLIGRLAALRTALASLSIANIGATLSTGVTAAGTAFATLQTAILGATRAALAFAFSPIGAALMAIGLAGYYAYTNWDKVAPVLNDIATTLGGIMKPAIDAAKNALDTLFQTLGQSFDSSTLQMLSTLIDALTAAVGGGLCGAFIALAGIVGSVLTGIVTGIAGLVKTIANLGTGLIEAFYKLSEGDYSGAFEKIFETGKQAVEDFKNANLDAFAAIRDGIAGTAEAINTFVHPEVRMAHEANIQSGGGLGAMNARIEQIDAGNIAAAPETPAIDTSATQAGLDAVGTSAQTAATNMDGVNTATQNISQAGDALSQLPANLSEATTGIQQVGTDAQTTGGHVKTLGTNSQTAGLNVQAVGNAAQTASPQVDALGVSSGGAQGNVAALGDSAGGSVGNILSMSDAAGAVASALRGKAAEIGAIHISIPTVSVGGVPAANYEGGIYKRGAFLTTFAERSPEAAIPLDNSQRAKDLWTQAGEMLGLLPQNQPFKFDKIPTTPPFNPEPEKTLPRGEQVPTRARRRPPQRQRRRPQIPPTQPVPQIKIPDWAMQPLPPFNPDASKSRPPITFGGDLSGGIFNPQTPAFDSDGLIGGLIGGLVNKIFGSPKSEPQPPIINLTVNVTINGDADEATVQRGVEAALPAVNDWARRYSEHQHEQRRRSYA